MTARGSAEKKITTNSKVNRDSILNAVINDQSVAMGKYLGDDRIEETHSGLVVDSSATHTLKSFLINAGGAGTAAVMGNVSVNEIGGSTTAHIANAHINAGSADDDANVSVRARDYTNSSGFVGTANVAGNAAIGASADTNIVSRTTEALVEGEKNGDT